MQQKVSSNDSQIVFGLKNSKKRPTILCEKMLNETNTIEFERLHLLVKNCLFLT